MSKLKCPSPRSPLPVAMKTNPTLAEVTRKYLGVHQKQSGILRGLNSLCRANTFSTVKGLCFLRQRLLFVTANRLNYGQPASEIIFLGESTKYCRAECWRNSVSRQTAAKVSTNFVGIARLIEARPYCAVGTSSRIGT